jgi:DNA-binding XRE family transcriptional regulator
MTLTAKKKSYRRGRPRRAELNAPGLPYTMKLGDGRTVFVEVPGRMATRDRGGETAFTPEGVQFLDRVRALATNLEGTPSPAFITALREAAGMTQEELGRRIGRHKLSVARWEWGTLHPDAKSVARLRELFKELKASGVVLPG